MRKFLFNTLVIFFIAAGCNDDDSRNVQPENEVRMESASFIPATLKFPVGTVVRGVNSSSVEHAVTSNDELFDEEVCQGKTFSYIFSEAGAYNYLCTIHSGMVGTIVVE